MITDRPSPPTRVHGTDALRALAGRSLGDTATITVGQDRIDAFAEATEDRQWIHVDVERAAAGPFGTTIAHGYLTLSLCSHFLDELLAVEGVSMIVNYGVERVRFPAPVPAGSELGAHGEVVDVRELEGGVQITVRFTITVAGAPKPSCVADMIIRYYD
jgi:acyl dehydratase